MLQLQDCFSRLLRTRPATAVLRLTCQGFGSAAQGIKLRLCEGQLLLSHVPLRQLQRPHCALLPAQPLACACAPVLRCRHTAGCQQRAHEREHTNGRRPWAACSPARGLPATRQARQADSTRTGPALPRRQGAPASTWWCVPSVSVGTGVGLSASCGPACPFDGACSAAARCCSASTAAAGVSTQLLTTRSSRGQVRQVALPPGSRWPCTALVGSCTTWLPNCLAVQQDLAQWQAVAGSGRHVLHTCHWAAVQLPARRQPGPDACAAAACRAPDTG